MGLLTDRIRQLRWVALLIIVIGISLSACGGDTATATPPPAATTAATAAAPGDTPTTGGTGGSASEQEVKVELKEFSITPADLTANAGKVRFVVTNVGTVSHNFTITSDSGVIAATKTFAPSESPQTLEADLKPGTYQTLCSVPGHAQHGQKGTLVVK